MGGLGAKGVPSDSSVGFAIDADALLPAGPLAAVERRRRLWAGAEALSHGRGGQAAVVRATGMSVRGTAL
jgi:hypothetical protein